MQASTRPSEDDLVYGMDEAASRNERMIIKAVGHLGVSHHRWTKMLSASWQTSGRPAA
jgi:hypothetical protein